MNGTRTNRYTSALFRWCLALAVASGTLTLAACENDEPDGTEIPAVAALEVSPGAIEVEPGEIELKLAELELEEVLPLDADDAGKAIMASGYVVGKPISGGFFLLTQDSHVLFVQTAEPVMPGDIVRVAGPLQAVAAPAFDGWELDAFELEGGVRADWDMERAWYIDAKVAEVYRRVNRVPVAVVAPVPSDTQSSPDTTRSSGQ